MIKNCPAVLIHVVLAIVIVISAAALSSQVKAEEAPDKRTFCLAVEYMSAEAMADRLANRSFAAALAQIDDDYSGNAVLIMTRVLEAAYNSPLADFTAKDDLGIITEFAAYVRLDCYHNWGKKR